MAKDKAGKGEKSIPNKHLHARTSFLYQAATYLSLQTSAQPPPEASKAQSITTVNTGHNGPPQSALALQLASHLRAVSLKAQIRLSPDMKRSICKKCNTVLIPGRTSTSLIENKSRGGRKPWADVLVIQCNFCGGQKRFPVGSTRQLPKSKRSSPNKDKKALGPANAKGEPQPVNDTAPGQVPVG